MSGYNTPFEALGEEGIRALTAAFYDYMDSAAQVADLRAMHGKDLEPMKERLAEYLISWMGGPQTYAEKYGSMCMTTPHKPYAIGSAERDQWLLCMDKALEQIGADDALKQMLKQPLFAVADMVRNRD
ncbi:hemoglobin [Marinobacterium halophilum]|uniref:Hemoglobin n=1 Tax=Marinobacterium halophilum TaxID=267374 RepID=A0A2P8ESV9_9GAMM|nr:group II truncated hemoglobin [Marinobacterium halophilum]PSL12532.1 hemoglobin [Marinobacterium halophilum]